MSRPFSIVSTAMVLVIAGCGGERAQSTSSESTPLPPPEALTVQSGAPAPAVGERAEVATTPVTPAVGSAAPTSVPNPAPATVPARPAVITPQAARKEIQQLQRQLGILRKRVVTSGVAQAQADAVVAAESAYEKTRTEDPQLLAARRAVAERSSEWERLANAKLLADPAAVALNRTIASQRTFATAHGNKIQSVRERIRSKDPEVLAALAASPADPAAVDRLVAARLEADPAGRTASILLAETEQEIVSAEAGLVAAMDRLRQEDPALAAAAAAHAAAEQALRETESTGALASAKAAIESARQAQIQAIEDALFQDPEAKALAARIKALTAIAGVAD